MSTRSRQRSTILRSRDCRLVASVAWSLDAWDASNLPSHPSPRRRGGESAATARRRTMRSLAEFSAPSASCISCSRESTYASLHSDGWFCHVWLAFCISCTAFSPQASTGLLESGFSGSSACIISAFLFRPLPNPESPATPELAETSDRTTFRRSQSGCPSKDSKYLDSSASTESPWLLLTSGSTSQDAT